MSDPKSEGRDARAPQLDRREFVGMSLKGVAALGALPAASLLATACGSSEQPAAKPTPAPKPAAQPTPPVPPAAKPAPAPTPPVSKGGPNALVTEIASASMLVSSLQYVNETPKPEQKCGGCQLYTAGEAGRGKCQLFTEGLVKESGWCLSWVAKVS